MRRTEQVQGLRLMKFEEVYGRTHRGGLSQAEAAEVLGVSERTFRRWRDRYEAEGADGLYDRLPGPGLGAARAGGRGGAGAGVVRHPLLGPHGQALPREAGGRSRLQAQLQLAAAELASPWAQARGAHAWGAPAQAAAPRPARHDAASGRLEPRVGPRSMVGPDRHHGRCDQRYLLGLLRRRRGHHVELPGGVRGDPGQGPVLLALRRPRQPLLEHARGRRQGGQGHPDPGRPRPGAARHRVDPGLLARGKGALGAHVRHPAEAPAPGTQARRHHRHGRGQPLPEGGLPATTQRPLRDPGRGPGHRLRPLHRRAQRHPVHPRGTHCLKRQHGALQAPGTSDPRRPPPPPLRQGQGPRPRIPRRHNGRLPMDRDVWRDTTPMANLSTAKPARPRDPLRRDRPAPCGQVDSRSAPDHFPTGPATATEAVNSYGT